MLVCSPQTLAFIAVPKTGSTAVEMALRPRADILFIKQRKHMTARRFHNKIAPFLLDTFDLRPDRIAVMREPEEQIRSWYRYRMREMRAGDSKGTHGMSFDEFVTDVLRDDPPPYADIGSQWNMLMSGRGKLLLHHLFAYEAQPLFQRFLDNRFGEPIKIEQRNVSPKRDAPLDPAIRARLRAKRAQEFALYDKLMDAGGHLATAFR